MLRRILEDTRALIRDVRAFGVRIASRWRWTRQRYRRRLSEKAADLENVRRSAEVATRMCTSCRALIPVSERLCPECGAVPGQRVTRGATRVMENMLPGTMSVSSGILTANIALYAFSLLVWNHLGSVLPPDLRDGAWNVTLWALGGNVPGLLVQGEVWRLLSSVFLHGGALHLLFNSWALLAVGPLCEQIYGARRFATMYVLSGAGASLASAVWRAGSPWSVSIGASGAIFGLIGIAAIWGWRRGGSVGQGIRAQMVQWAIYVLVLGFLFRFDNAAHIGGMITGAALALVIPDTDHRTRASAAAWEALGWCCGLAVVASFLLVALRYGDTLAFFM